MTFLPTCDCGTCPKCKHRVYCAAWRERNPESPRAASRRYYQARKPRWTRDPVVRKAQHLVYTEIRAGRMVRQPCEICGSEKADAHHDDYARPLEVRWLCRRHHVTTHVQAAL